MQAFKLGHVSDLRVQVLNDATEQQEWIFSGFWLVPFQLKPREIQVQRDFKKMGKLPYHW